MNYENKYHKYKNKYLKIKKMIGGSNNMINYMYEKIINNEIHNIQQDENGIIISAERELFDIMNVFYFIQQNVLENLGLYNSKIVLIEEENFKCSTLGKRIQAIRPVEHPMLLLINILMTNCYYPIIISKKRKEENMNEYIYLRYDVSIVEDIIRKHYINIPCNNLINSIKEGDKIKYSRFIGLMDNIKENKIHDDYSISCSYDVVGERDDILLIILSKYFMEQRVGQEVYIATDDFFKNFSSIKEGMIKMRIEYDGLNVMFRFFQTLNVKSFKFVNKMENTE
jgi:hypothetical protein